jgi:universal stress protein E
MLSVHNVDYVPATVVDRVGRIVRGLGAELLLFSSIYEPDMIQERDEAATGISALVDDAHRRLERIADMFREQSVIARCSVRWDYPAYEAVVRQVLRHRIDLLVVPARGTGDIGLQTLHYRESRLIETCPCPLLLLKSSEAYARGPIVAAVDPMHACEAPDEVDEGVIEAAKTLSYSLTEAPVHLCHADVPQRIATGVPGGAVSSCSEQQRTRRHRVYGRVRDLAERHDIPSANVRIVSGPVETTLPEFARTEHANVIVMGALSRAYPQRALLGHKAERVLDAVSCDVLVIKPRGFRCPVDREPAPAVPIPGLENGRESRADRLQGDSHRERARQVPGTGSTGPADSTG